MQFGLGVLRLAPKDFWAMSPRELAAAHSDLSPDNAAGPGAFRRIDAGISRRGERKWQMTNTFMNSPIL